MTSSRSRREARKKFRAEKSLAVRQMKTGENCSLRVAWRVKVTDSHATVNTLGTLTPGCIANTVMVAKALIFGSRFFLNIY